MAQQSEPSYPVIGPQMCSPSPVEIAILKKYFGDTVVEDTEGNPIFQVKGASFLSIHDKQTILDAAGNPIVTLQAKILTAHYRWKAFRGGSTDDRDLIFSAKTSSIIQPLGTVLHVFLASTASEDVYDYKVKGSLLQWSCAVYKGESSTIVAQMSKKFTMLNKDKFVVTVSPNFDSAFVAALILILDAINHQRANVKKNIRRLGGLF